MPTIGVCCGIVIRMHSTITLHQVEGGEKVTEVCRRLGISEQTFTAGESRPRDPRQRVRRDTARMGALHGTSGSCRIPHIARRFGLSDGKGGKPAARTMSAC